MLTPNVNTDHPPLEAEEDDTPTVKRITNPNEDAPEELELEPFDEATQELRYKVVAELVGFDYEVPFDPDSWMGPDASGLEPEPCDEVTQELPLSSIEALDENAPEQPVLPPNRQGFSGWQRVVFLFCLLIPHDVQAWWLLENRSTQPQEVQNVRQ